MLRHKDNTILSEINVFFTTNEKAMHTIFKIIGSLTFSGNRFLGNDMGNNIYKDRDKLVLLLLFPFFGIKDAYHYGKSSLYGILSCGKDVFYRLLNDGDIDWRSINYGVARKLIKETRDRAQAPTGEDAPRCLIVDDTDLPKTGRRIELIGRIYSHVSHSSLLAFKGLFMAYHDGKSLFALDFSLHGEKGKNRKRPYGLTVAQGKRRYAKERAAGSQGLKRRREYFSTKIEGMIAMLRKAIGQGVRFDYLLVDSWFTCHELVRFIKTRRIGCHLLGMIKMGITKYGYEGESRSAKQILDLLRRTKRTKRSRATGLYYGEAIVDFKGIRVKLFFSKTSKRGKWHGLLTTDLDLSFERAYKIYSTRWAVEVYFKESKQHLGLGKCESRDFDAQIAHTSLCMVRYNVLSVAKRFEGYETMGELFREANADALELTISERVWLILLELVAKLVEILEVDPEMLMEKLIAENEELMKLINLRPYMQAG
jgi:hypothetical protein